MNVNQTGAVSAMRVDLYLKNQDGALQQAKGKGKIAGPTEEVKGVRVNLSQESVRLASQARESAADDRPGQNKQELEGQKGKPARIDFFA